MFQVITTNKRKTTLSDYDLRVVGEKLEFSPEFFQANNLENTCFNYGKIGEDYGIQLTPEGQLFKKKVNASKKGRTFTNPVILANLAATGVDKFHLNPYNGMEGVFTFSPIRETVAQEETMTVSQFN